MLQECHRHCDNRKSKVRNHLDKSQAKGIKLFTTLGIVRLRERLICAGQHTRNWGIKWESILSDFLRGWRPWRAENVAI
jgi:hypothetical protein